MKLRAIARDLQISEIVDHIENTYGYDPETVHLAAQDIEPPDANRFRGSVLLLS